MPFDPTSTLISADGEPALADVAQRMRDDLAAAAQLAALPDLSDRSLTLVSLNERPVGVGAFRGNEARGPLPLVALKGGRLDAVARFELWGGNSSDVDAATALLQANLLAARDDLRSELYLKVDPFETSSAERIPTGALSAVWRKAASYRVLYEYHYRDTDAAESLIHRIPVNSDPEQLDSPDRETFTVTGPVVRWDRLEAASLRVRGPRTIQRLQALIYLPGATPSGEVTLTRTHDDATGLPPQASTPVDFLTAVGDPEAPTRHLAYSLPMADFLTALGPATEGVDMGDWERFGVDDAVVVVDSYEIRALDLTLGIPLPRDEDRFEISFEHDRFPDGDFTVLYLRIDPA